MLHRLNPVKSTLQIQTLDIRSPISDRRNHKLPAMLLRFIQDSSHCLLSITLISGANNEATQVEHYEWVFFIHVATDVVLPHSLRPGSIKRHESPVINVALPGTEIQRSLPMPVDDWHGPRAVVRLD